VIEEASQSIIDIAHVLPNFSERTFSELLRREGVLIDAAQKTLDGLDRIRSQAKEDQAAESTKFETEYRRALVRNLNKVELFGVDLSSRANKSHPLSVAYVSLDVGSSVKRDQEEPGGVVSDEEDAEDESSIHNVELALAQNDRILIKGPAGAGKTTLIHWIAVKAAAGDFEGPLGAWNNTLPFVIRLRHFGDSDFPPPEAFPSLIASSIAGTMPKGWVHERLSSGNAVVMVDGVDEVAQSRRGEVRKWLKELTDTFPRCRFVVTSRPHAVEDGWLEAESFSEAYLQPMDTSAIENFIDHWHKAVAEEVLRESEIVDLGRLAENLKKALRENRAIRRLATNPLLCSVICALHRDTNEQIPKDRLDLYERCCSMLLERRDPESGLRMSGYPKLSYRQKRSLLDDLAYWMVKNEWAEIPIDAARERFQRKIETLRFDPQDGPVAAKPSCNSS
jgi:predicted NACHT family NTPase